LARPLDHDDVGETADDQQIPRERRQRRQRIEGFGRQILQHGEKQHDRRHIADRVAAGERQRRQRRQGMRVDAGGRQRAKRAGREARLDERGRDHEQACEQHQEMPVDKAQDLRRPGQRPSAMPR
jgi:hypothetical protein